MNAIYKYEWIFRTGDMYTHKKLLSHHKKVKVDYGQ